MHPRAARMWSQTMVRDRVLPSRWRCWWPGRSSTRRCAAGPVALSDHSVGLAPLRRSKTTDHRHGRVVRALLGAFLEGGPPRCSMTPALYSGGKNRCVVASDSISRAKPSSWVVHQTGSLPSIASARKASILLIGALPRGPRCATVRRRQPGCVDRLARGGERELIIGRHRAERFSASSCGNCTNG